MGCKAWEVFTLVIRGTCGEFLGAALASYTDKETLLLDGFQFKKSKILKSQVDQGKEGPSLHPYAPSLQIGPFTYRRTTAKGSSKVNLRAEEPAFNR
jgi:hypothetical protein